MVNSNLLLEIQSLEKKIEKYNKAYYDENKSLISDYEYDLLKKKLTALRKEACAFKDCDIKIDKSNEKEKQQSNLFGEEVSNENNNQLIERSIGYKANAKFKKITHKKKMMSLANALNLNELNDFFEKTKRFLKADAFPESICELKIDGLSFSAVYKYGVLQYVATRGDGLIGEDVTKNVLQIANFPQELQKIDGVINQPCEMECFEARGEIFMPKNAFERLNENLSDDEKFSNPRNAASGTLRQLDANIVKERQLSYYAYFIGNTSKDIVSTQADALKVLEQLGFIVENHWKIAKTEQDIIDFHEQIAKIRYTLECDIDGVVVKINSFKTQQILGTTASDPRWAIAYKFSGITAITKLIGVKNQVGRTGVITPVAELLPVNIGGVIVKRATLHNYDEIKRLGLSIGDNVVVKRSGDVIPKIVSIEEKNKENDEPILPPKNCPCCSAELVYSDEYVAIVCPNRNGCKDQIVDKIRHFVSREGFDVNGLGKQNISRFYDLGFLKKPTDIFSLKNHTAELSSLEGFGQKSVMNLLASIEEKKHIIFNKFLYALGIGDIGENVAKIIAKQYKDIDEMLADKQFSKLQNINGIGGKMIQNFISFFQQADNLEMVSELKQICNILPIENIETKFSGKSVVFTGSLQTMTRQQAKIQAEEAGFKVLTDISKATTFLVFGEKAGSKLKKAQELGIEILSEGQWQNLLKS